MDQRKTRKTRTGATGPSSFTLIELLVVVAIIAVLVAVLLPALNAARERAHGVGCAGHQRQIGVGLTYYADEYGGYLHAPVSQLSSNPTDYLTWDVTVGRLYLASPMNWQHPEDDERSVFICPGDREPRHGNSWRPWNIPRSYARVCWKRPGWAWAYNIGFFRFAEFAEPARRFAVAEWRWWGNTRGVNWPGCMINRSYWRYGWDLENTGESEAWPMVPYAPIRGQYHADHPVFLFLDGHVSRMSTTEAADRDEYWRFP